jgi:hypothetical protein
MFDIRGTGGNIATGFIRLGRMQQRQAQSGRIAKWERVGVGREVHLSYSQLFSTITEGMVVHIEELGCLGSVTVSQSQSLLHIELFKGFLDGREVYAFRKNGGKPGFVSFLFQYRLFS